VKRIHAILVALLAGCGGSRPETTEAERFRHFLDDAGHLGPRGGTLVVLGNHDAHLELEFDPNSGTLTAYAMDAAVTRTIRLAQPAIAMKLQRVGRRGWFEMTLDSTNDPSGSVFRGTNARLAGAERFRGTILEVRTPRATFANVDFAWPSGNIGVPSDETPGTPEESGESSADSG
jgi:hypothetical protein